ncbi:MAG: DNA protecting protein DprA [Candidatus Tagabacteria bacterium RIFCSPLOWO2_01_FULL_39_11]|uniref:DNA protecting protein DprA n=1 Tax=Candidatus Tagabacteria bacterium RIFCSPLOWO2_01_FULL_39_11 TaxID=1802295 RepID=A0A1G2LR42_9BACT|nr:MAG: DNA protecting protein DprA [Candidatus Tagabacteria bacterium RIFCSPLOWO2_01_FULL_39_11]
MPEEEIKFTHGFNLIKDIGLLRMEKIKRSFKSYKAAWEAPEKEIKEKIKDETTSEIILQNRQKINLEKEWEKLKKDGIKILVPECKEYPPLLKEISHPPQILYYLGNLKKIHVNYSVAIVGTRKATPYGLEASFKLASDLACKNINIVSGLAYGIDAYAHKGCLEMNGATFAVLGSGVLKIYPKTNIKIAEAIIANNGAVISEFPPLLEPDKWTFPQRNRIVAGLSHAVIVVEAPEKSGALITAGFATDANRDIGAVPGEIFSINSKGTNMLLKNGASPIMNADDVLEILGIREKAQAEEIFDETEKNILKCLESPKDTENLRNEMNIDIKILNQKLSLLEIRGVIKNENGRFYKIL